MKRVIGEYHGDTPGPLLICTGGIHGNEPAGVNALTQVCQKLSEGEFSFHGSFYAIAGNLTALKEGVRFIDTDLNRIWTRERMEQRMERQVEKGHPVAPPAQAEVECKEQYELFVTLEEIVRKHVELPGAGPVYVMDLHTSSSETIPFIYIHDRTETRDFAKVFDVPVIFGAESIVGGTFCDYAHRQGYIVGVYEGGLHTCPRSIENHEAFTWLGLYESGVLQNEWRGERHYATSYLAQYGNHVPHELEIFYRHHVEPEDGFAMVPGFKNFDVIQKGQLLAKDGSGQLCAPMPCRVFLPLYQPLGDDGYFLVRERIDGEEG